MKIIKKHLLFFIRRIDRDRLDSASAHGAFFIMISSLPFVALLLTLMQRVSFSPGVTMIEAMLRLLPDALAGYVQELFPSPITSTGVLPIALITLLWTSSKGMQAIIKGLDHVFDDQEERGFIRLRIISMIYIVLLAAVLALTAALLVFGSTIYNYLLDHSPPFFAILLMQFKSLAGFVVLFVFFVLLYRFLPRRRVRFLHILAGSAFTAAAWVLFSFFFSLFVENFSGFSIYGGLATLVILMYWLFFCVYIILLGAEVTMWLEISGIQNDIKTAWKRFQKKRARRLMNKEK